ncbi:MAG TPA: tyrosine-type recombinase/integrase, partial [Streptosporangiaceae bacterium]|nr:tyrosine-type recombinase/integrase [Streptosporangiaceae bacterium]
RRRAGAAHRACADLFAGPDRAAGLRSCRRGYRAARAIDLAVGERGDGPVFLSAGGRRLDRHGASRIVRRVARRAGIGKKIGPHTLRHAFITAALDAGVPLRDVQEAASHADPRTTMRYDRARGSLDRHATYIVAAYLAGAAR